MEEAAWSFNRRREAEGNGQNTTLLQAPSSIATGVEWGAGLLDSLEYGTEPTVETQPREVAGSEADRDPGSGAVVGQSSGPQGQQHQHPRSTPAHSLYPFSNTKTLALLRV